MKNNKPVTFGASGFDRATHLRNSASDSGNYREKRKALVLPFWRGKPLLDHERESELAVGYVSRDHPILDLASVRIFLGRDDAGEAVFAADISAWEPAEMPDTLGNFLDPSEQTHPALPDHLRFGELRAAMTRLPARDAEIAAIARGLFEWHRTHGFCAACGSATEIADAGWRRECPACGRHHFPRTDPVVIMLVVRGNRVLLGRAPGWPDKMYSCLAGFIEPGETVEGAVRRETMEETGVEIGAVRYLASQPWPFPASLMIGCHAEALSEEIRPQPDEIEHALWLTREELAEAFMGRHPDVAPARPGAIAHYLLHNWLADTVD